MSGRYVSLQEAAEMLAVSVKTVRRFIARGELPAYTLGKRGAGSGRPIRIRVDDLATLLHRIPTAGDDRPHVARRRGLTGSTIRRSQGHWIPTCDRWATDPPG